MHKGPQAEAFRCLRDEAPWALGLLARSGWPSQEKHLHLPQPGNRRDSMAGIHGGSKRHTSASYSSGVISSFHLFPPFLG